MMIGMTRPGYDFQLTRRGDTGGVGLLPSEPPALHHRRGCLEVQHNVQLTPCGDAGRRATFDPTGREPSIVAGRAWEPDAPMRGLAGGLAGRCTPTGAHGVVNPEGLGSCPRCDVGEATNCELRKPRECLTGRRPSPSPHPSG